MTEGALSGLAIAVVTVSDSVSSGETQDLSGPEAVKFLEAAGASIYAQTVVPDDRDRIVSTLRGLAAGQQGSSGAGPAVVVTTGGTGVSPRDLTPEATMDVCDRLVPGLAELMRMASLRKTPYAALSRAVAGISGRVLIVNLPGSPGGVRDCLEAVADLLPHAVGLLKDEPTPHRQT